MNNATMNTRRTISEKASYNNSDADVLEKAAVYRSNAKPGSLTSKANLVSDYNSGAMTNISIKSETNNKKKKK